MVTPVGVSDCLFVLARCIRTSCQGQKPPAVSVGRGLQLRPDRLSSSSTMATPRMAGRYDHRRPRAKSGDHVRLPWRRSWRSARGPPSRTRPRRPSRPRPVPSPRPSSPRSRRRARRAPTRARRALAGNLAGRERPAARGDRRTCGSGDRPGAGEVNDPREGGGKVERRPAAPVRDAVWCQFCCGCPPNAVDCVGMRSPFVRTFGPAEGVVRRGVDRSVDQHGVLLMRRCGRARPRPGALPPGCQASATQQRQRSTGGVRYLACRGRFRAPP